MIGLDDIQIDQINEPKAIQLVNFVSQNNKFELNKDAAQFLSQLKGNIAFIVVCGKYRTGKSFLLNKLIDVQNEGFKVNPSTSSCTQGIWLYTKPIVNKSSNLQIYFLDSEGSESGEKSQTHDAKIFALAILISSTFMFNSLGCIDEQSITQLHLTTLLSKNIFVQEQHENNNESILGYYTPKFIWLLRDFVLEMKDNQNRRITPKEYLELALYDDKQFQSENSKKVRRSLLTYFKDRTCFPFVRPMIDENQLQQLNKVPFKQLREEFQQQLNQLRDYLLKTTSPKQMNGVNLNGRMYCRMIETYIGVINKGGVPVISTAWEHIVEAECQHGLSQAKQLYDQNLKQYFGSDEARSFEEIFQILKKIRDESFQTFHQIAGIRERNNHFEEFKKKLLDYMTEKENLAIKLNDDMNNTKNEEVIAEISQKLKENLEQETFTIDNLEVFFQHFNEFLNAYDKKSAGTEKANTLIHFLQNHHPIIIKQLMNSVIQKYNKSKNLTEQEKAAQQIKEKELLENIKTLEQSIAQHETKIRKLDQEKIQLEAQKKQLSEQLGKLQTENKTIRDNIKNVEDLENQIVQKNEEIQKLKTMITSLQTKRKKGCCG